MSRPRTRQEFARRLETATGTLLVNAKVTPKPRSKRFSLMRLAGRNVGVCVIVRDRCLGVGLVDWTAATSPTPGYEPRPIRQRIVDRYGAAKAKVAASL